MSHLKHIRTLIFFIHLFFALSKCQSASISAAKVGKGNIQGRSTSKADDDFTISAQWASNFFSIDITIKTNEAHDLLNNCSILLDENSLTLIGDQSACIWTKTTGNKLQLTIYLASSAIIALQDTLTIWNHTQLIEIPKKLTEPNIITSSSAQIGSCDDLILDARATTNLGARDAVFTWIITQNDDETDTITYTNGGSYIIVNHTLLLSSTTYNIALTVTNWYGASTTTQYSIYKSSEVFPVVTLHAVDEYSITSLNANDNIQIYSDITLHDECTSEISHIWVYNIEWKVAMNAIPEYEEYLKRDTPKFKALQKRLQDFDDIQALSITASSYLQSGYIYSFSMQLECFTDSDINKNSPECDTTTVHDLKVDFSDIECGIFGGDLVLNNIPPNMVPDVAIIALDGLSLTCDAYDSLEWFWDCVIDESGASCVDLLDINDAALVNIDLNSLDVEYEHASSYMYTVTMTVDDTANIFRNSCIDTISFTINTADDDSSNSVLFVTATAVRSEINNNDALRVIGSVSEMMQDTVDEYIFEYEWQEINGLLAENDLVEYNQINLILDSDLLQQGQTYEFQLKVTAIAVDSGDIVACGESNSVSVYIKQAPLITSGSFEITPQCNNEYESISDLLSVSHSVSISADGDNAPLSYEFGMKINDNRYYFRDTYYDESSLNNLYLPPLESFVIFTNVYDVESSVVSEEIECSVTLQSYSECIDIEPLLDVDLILQQSFVYLQYLTAYEGNDEDCVEAQVLNILNLIHEQYTVDSCDEYDVIQLTQTMMLLLSIINTDASDINIDDDVLNQIEDLLFLILDPCLYITQEIGNNLDDLSIADDSVLSGEPAIYYNDLFISSQLSPIISDPQYQDLLFAIISETLTLIQMYSVSSASNSMQLLYDVLSSTIYIAQMVDISVSISGESHFAQFDLFSIYSERVIPGQTVDVEIENVVIHIPNENTITETDSLLAASYVFISVVEITNEFESQLEGLLIGDLVLDITLLSDAVDSSNLPSNIDFTLKSEDETDVNTYDYTCVWYNKADDEWSEDGCIATIDAIENEIKCSCQHLTTFAVIYNMHQDSETDVFVDDESSELEIYAHWLLSAIFLMISIYILFQIYPFFTNKELEYKHTSVFVMSLVAITSFLYFLICLEYLFASFVSITAMSLLLLLPHISYLLIFSVLFYTWFNLVHAFNPNIPEMRSKLKHILIALNITISSLLFVYFMLILFNVRQVFKIASFLWSALTVLITLIITVYAIIAGKVLYQTTKKSVSNQSFAAKDWKVVRRLITINSCITFYFIFETFLNIYYAIHMDKATNIMSHKLLDLFVNVFCLVCICWMYREPMKRLIKINLYLVEKHKQDVAQRRKTQTTIDMPSRGTTCSSQPQSLRRNTFATVNSETKSPQTSMRVSMNKLGLPPIAEQSLDQKEDDSNDGNVTRHKIQNTVTVAPQSNSNETRDSVIIAADIIIPDVSAGSHQRDTSLIIPEIKHSKQRSFQFYYNLREKFNSIVHDTVAKDTDNDTEQQQNNEKVDSTETAMYAYMCSRSQTSK